MPQYNLLYSTDVLELQAMTTDHLKHGWLLAGGLAVAVGHLGSPVYYQAVYKPYIRPVPNTGPR